MPGDASSIKLEVHSVLSGPTLLDEKAEQRAMSNDGFKFSQITTYLPKNIYIFTSKYKPCSSPSEAREWKLRFFILNLQNSKPRQYGSVKNGRVQYGSVLYVNVKYGSVHYGSVQYVSVQYGNVKYGSVINGSVQYGSLLYGNVKYGSVQYGSVQYVSV